MDYDPLSKAVNDLFGLSYLFPYQRLVIANILEAASDAGIKLNWSTNVVTESAANAVNDVLSDRESMGRQIVILPTGAGKSLCFQLPAMLMDKPTLVIYPILGLMADQERRLSERGFAPVVLRGSQTMEEREEIFSKLKSGKSKFIIANPEILLTRGIFPRLKDMGIVHIVIDEAHCVSEWGESFRPSYLEINKIIKEAGSPLVTAFTATAGSAVLEKIEKYIFGSLGAARIVGNPDRKNIYYSSCGCLVKNLAVRDLLHTMERPAIVFCSSRPATEKLALYLRNEAVKPCARPGAKLHFNDIRFYHAGLSREEKKECEDWFLHNPKGVLTATCAYGLGIDKSDIRTVIHRDTPPSVEAYLQESGRAGRDGLGSGAVLLWGPEDDNYLALAKSKEERLRLEKLLLYARDPIRCRRDALLDLLDYDGERDSPGAACCDVCEKKFSPYYREQKSLVDFFKKNRGRYTSPEAVKILSCAENIGWTEDDAEEAVLYLIKDKKLKISTNPLWKRKIFCV